ncbi:MAG TPA: hypothetical protein VM901_06715 [Bdellovibrionota bacterium]|jgi:tetratricopeptide (TPR) repeat protein|nr:hypothetical protein [Bdellovibrionota bacterium]
MARLLIAAFLVPAAFASPSLAPWTGFTQMSPTGQNVRWAQLPLQICPSAELPAAVRAEVEPAAEIWNQHFGQKIFRVDCAAKDRVYNEQNLTEHGIYWSKKDFAKLTDKTVLARTLLQFDDAGTLLDGDIVLNGEYYEWSRLPIDARTVIAHELGHLLGLKHYFLALDSVMNYYPYLSGYRHHRIGTYETLTVNALYFNKSSAAPNFMQLYFADQAKAALDALLKIKTKSFGDHYAIGTLATSLGDRAVARSHFEAAQKLDPNSTIAELKVAESLWAAGETAGAEAQLNKLIGRDKRNYEAFADLGGIMLQRGDREGATRAFKRSLEIQPAHWRVCELLQELTQEKTYAACVKRYGPETPAKTK